MTKKKDEAEEFDHVKEAERLNDLANEVSQKSADPLNTPEGRRQAEERGDA